jgi:acyl-CoA thioester hydrolase
MGVVNHANYIRWFEEAREELLEVIGIADGKIEDYGIMFPVLKVEANYRKMLHFRDEVSVDTAVRKYNGIKVLLEYKVINEANGKLCCDGYSEHCFLNQEGRPVSLKDAFPEVDKLFQTAFEHDNA